MSIPPNDAAASRETHGVNQLPVADTTSRLWECVWDLPNALDMPERPQPHQDEFDWVQSLNCAPCVSFAITVPTRYNPRSGQRVGEEIPLPTLNRVKRELCELTGGLTYQGVDRFHAPLLVATVAGEWDEPDAEAPGGITHYCDCNALRIVANVDVHQAVAIGERLLTSASHWAAELRQRALYVEISGWGQVYHLYVRPHLDEFDSAQSITHAHEV